MDSGERDYPNKALGIHYQTQLLCRPKPENHSAKSLSSVTLNKEVSVNCTSTTISLSSTFCRALGKEKSSSRHQVTVTKTLSSVYYTDTQQRSILWAPLLVPLPSVLGGTQKRLRFRQVSTGLVLGKGSTSWPICQFLCRVH
jgi:hypothetical protein